MLTKINKKIIRFYKSDESEEEEDSDSDYDSGAEGLGKILHSLMLFM